MESMEPFLGQSSQRCAQEARCGLGRVAGRETGEGGSDNRTAPWSHLHTRFHLAFCKHLQQEQDPGPEKQVRAKRKMRPNSEVAQALCCLK